MNRNYFHAYSPFHYDRSIDYKCSILPSFHTFNSIKPCRTQTIQNVSGEFYTAILCLQEPCVATISQLHRKLSIALFVKCRLQCCTGQFIKNIAFTRIHIHLQRIKCAPSSYQVIFRLSNKYVFHKRPLLHLRTDFTDSEPLYGPYRGSLSVKSVRRCKC